MSGTVHVTHLGDDRFEVTVRGHVVLTDQPTGDGGTDVAPTPTELFISGLASCMAFYARRYCARHHIDPAGLEVGCRYRIGAQPTRVDEISVHITPPAAMPAERLAPFLAVASHCTVHNTLSDPPQVRVALADGEQT